MGRSTPIEIIYAGIVYLSAREMSYLRLIKQIVSKKILFK